jgi:hypothetical protein
MARKHHQPFTVSEVDLASATRLSGANSSPPPPPPPPAAKPKTTSKRFKKPVKHKKPVVMSKSSNFKKTVKIFKPVPVKPVPPSPLKRKDLLIKKGIQN